MVVGSKPGEEASIELRELMQRRARLMGTTLRTRPSEEKGMLVQAFGRRVVPLLASGAVAPLVDRTFSAGRRGGRARLRAAAGQARQAAARGRPDGALTVAPLRAGIVGGGWIARVHVPAIDAAPGVELVAACDL